MKKIFLVVLAVSASLVFPQGAAEYFYPDYTGEKIPVRTVLNKIRNVDISGNIDIMVVVIGFPDRDNSWPVIVDDPFYPILGTFPNGALLRDSLKKAHVSVEEWYGSGLKHYLEFNSGGKVSSDIVFPKRPDGKAYTTQKSFEEWALRHGSVENVCFDYWRGMLNEVIPQIWNNTPELFDEIDLIQIVFTGIEKSEYHVEYGGSVETGSYSYTRPDDIKVYIYKGPVGHNFGFKSIAHETFHLIGQLAGSPGGFGGLPDRNANRMPYNSTVGYDLMFNAGNLPSEISLYGLPPLLTFDRIFMGWIDTTAILTTTAEDLTNIRLKDVNLPLSEEEKEKDIFRAMKIMLNPEDKNDISEYFLLEFKNGTGFDRNLSNQSEPGPHSGILIWHIFEKNSMLNLHNDYTIDLEAALPYNGWKGNPLPADNYPRDYERPERWNKENFGEYDYLDDLFMDKEQDPPMFLYLPDGGIHLWEKTAPPPFGWDPTDGTHFIRSNSMQSNFYSDIPVKGFVNNAFSDTTYPSSRKRDGSLTHITIKNIRRSGEYMALDIDADDWSGPPSKPKVLFIDTVKIGQNIYPNVKWVKNPDPDVESYDIYRRMLEGNKWLDWEFIGGRSLISRDSTSSVISFPDFDIHNQLGKRRLTEYSVIAIDIQSLQSERSDPKKIDNSLLVSDSTNLVDPETFEYELMQNYPNPFNPATVIRYSVPEDIRVTIKIYDILGRLAATPVDEIKKTGRHNCHFNAGNLSSGIYIYMMKAGKYSEIRKMTVIK